MASPGRKLVDLTGDGEENTISSSSSSSSSNWACPSCTLINPSSFWSCDACGHGRNQAGDAALAAALAEQERDEEGDGDGGGSGWGHAASSSSSSSAAAAAVGATADDAALAFALAAEEEEEEAAAEGEEQVAIDLRALGGREGAVPGVDYTLPSPYQWYNNSLNPACFRNPGANRAGWCLSWHQLFQVDFAPREIDMRRSTRDAARGAASSSSSSSSSSAAAGIAAPPAREYVSEILLSSFGTDIHTFLRPLLRADGPRVTLVAHTKEKHLTGTTTTPFPHIPNVKILYPPMKSDYATMHSKIILILFKDAAQAAAEEEGVGSSSSSGGREAEADGGEGGGEAGARAASADMPKAKKKAQGTRVRVVVHSSNMSHYDWWEMGQVMWVQDFFPRKDGGEVQGEAGEGEAGEGEDAASSSCSSTSSPAAAAAGPASGDDADYSAATTETLYISPVLGDFEVVLRSYLHRWTLENETIDRLLGGFDFSQAAVDLLPSAPGNHTLKLSGNYGNSINGSRSGGGGGGSVGGGGSAEAVAGTAAKSFRWDWDGGGRRDTAFGSARGGGGGGGGGGDTDEEKAVGAKRGRNDGDDGERRLDKATATARLDKLLATPPDPVLDVKRPFYRYGHFRLRLLRTHHKRLAAKLNECLAAAAGAGGASSSSNSSSSSSAAAARPALLPSTQLPGGATQDIAMQISSVARINTNNLFDLWVSANGTTCFAANALAKKVSFAALAAPTLPPRPSGGKKLVQWLAEADAQEDGNRERSAAAGGGSWRSPFTIVFPDTKTMEAPHARGTKGYIFLPITAWKTRTFPQGAMGHFEVRQDWHSSRGGVVAHAKVMLPVADAGTRQGEPGGGGGAGGAEAPIRPFSARVARDWSYIGSHNASNPAWGTISDVVAEWGPSNRIVHWEMGVVCAPVFAVTLPAAVAAAVRSGKPSSLASLPDAARVLVQELRRFQVLANQPSAFPHLFRMPPRPYRLEGASPDEPWGLGRDSYARDE